LGQVIYRRSLKKEHEHTLDAQQEARLEIMDEHLDEIGFGEEVMDTSTDLVEIASSARVLRFSDAAVVNDTQSSVDTPKEFVPVQEGSHLDNVGLEGTLSDYSASLCSVPAVSQAILVSEAPITAASVGPTAALVAQSVTAPQPTPVEVYVRVRPLNTEERGRGETSTITVLDERTLITTAPQVRSIVFFKSFVRKQ